MVCGLGVSASDDSTLLIESGMALDYQGRMVVVEEPLLRKLQMIEGQETLQGQESAYLCLSFDETDVEPVNAVGADTGASRQCNMTSEGCRLFLTAQPPEFRGLLEAAGRDNVSVLYASKELTLVLCAPEAVCAGEEFTVEVLVVKNERTPAGALQAGRGERLCGQRRRPHPAGLPGEPGGKAPGLHGQLPAQGAPAGRGGQPPVPQRRRDRPGAGQPQL